MYAVACYITKPLREVMCFKLAINDLTQSGVLKSSYSYIAIIRNESLYTAYKVNEPMYIFVIMYVLMYNYAYIRSRSHDHISS